MNQGNAAAQLVEELLTKPRAGDIEVIHCRRNFPYELTSPQWDPTWEGYKTVTENGVTVHVIDPSYNLRIETNGTCKIHKTPNNLKKLERLEKGTVSKRKVKKYDPVLGENVLVEEVVVIAPEYERLQKSIIEDDLIQRIAKAVSEINQPKNEPKEEEVFDGAAVADEVKRQRGRPRVNRPTA